MAKTSKINARATSKEDTALGLKIRTRRTLAGMSQADLGAALNVSFQQIQKYEKGVNRVTYVNLQRIANALGENISYFTGLKHDAMSVVANELAEALSQKYAQRLVRAYTKLPEDLQHRLVTLTESMVEGIAA